MPKLTRRTFVQSVSTMGLTLPALLPRLARAASPNGVLNHGVIGIGSVGWADINIIGKLKQVKIVALCDVDSAHLDRASGLKPEARRHVDWREMIAAEGDKIDSVNIAVPDHMHCAIAMAAIQARKHVYCQKPMCHDVAEVRALTQAAVKAGVVTQLGTQHASGVGDRMAVGFMKQKVIGKIKRLVLCSNRPGAVEKYRLVGPRPAQGEAPPSTLNWDLWIGNAPMRPFAPAIYHPQIWRSWQDFGTGWSGDIGCHIFDAPWKGLSMTAPKTVTAEVQASWKNSPARRADTWPQADHITWVFPGNEFTDGDLTVEWFDGEIFPPADVQKMADIERYPGEAAMIIGTDGAILLPHTGGPQLLPREKYKEFPRPKLAGREHHEHFVNACLGSEMCESHFAQTGPMTEAILLGTVAIRNPGVTLAWDAKKMSITNHPEANKMLRRTYRAGWEIAGVA